MTLLRRLLPLVLLAACGTEVPRGERATHRPLRTTRAPEPSDTAVFVAKQAGEPVATVSAVMQLRVAARDAEISVANGAGREAMTGALGGDNVEEIVGSRAESVPEGPEAAQGWRATVSVPALEGEHYLVEVAPSTPRRDTAAVELSADGVRLGAASAEVDASGGETALFDVTVGSRTLTVSPPITRIDIVPTCGTSHLVRSTGRADLFAQYEVIDTHERGDIHIPPRADDAQFRSVSFHTATRGAVRISYLGRELATAQRPEACPD